MKMASGRRTTTSLSLPLLCLLSLTRAGLQKSDQVVLRGDDVTLPCGVPTVNTCSSVSWNVIGEFGSVSAVVNAGTVMDPYMPRFRLLKDCSLKINDLILTDARTYLCHSNGIHSNVSLYIIEITESSRPADGTIELQCFLNTYQGYRRCINRGFHVEWRSEHDTLSSGKRFHIENPSECFSKLLINTKPTDHRRKWKCCMYQNGTLKASITHTTTVRDGIEKVFASVGESVSLSCHNTSSLGMGGSVEWDLGGEALSRGSSSLIIAKVGTVHAGEYQCLDSADRQRVFNRISLQTLEVTAESVGGHLALTCVLTCAGECKGDSSLAWRGGGADGWQNASVSVNRTLRNRLVLPVSSAAADHLTCLVLSDGVVTASTKWRAINSPWSPAWLLLPLTLLTVLAAAGIYVHCRRQQDAESGDAQLNLGLVHIYEVCQDQNESPEPPTQEAAESFYHLLQPVN
ncbi:uncharacterized protein LOC130532665 isoform X3 [Takifugu flavidus]|uniref:uncharacterized protein LOC130532665 isoform X3 n=1 Tax=Takifugu flavidus TaxID=433684 RepID=UPI002544BA9F|nr:uncharacterized protein LOC130532665 isoform X3 [Takifugu flavidus]